jgi:hypothetical protein
MGGFVVWWRAVLILVFKLSVIEVDFDEIEKRVDMFSARYPQGYAHGCSAPIDFVY